MTRKEVLAYAAGLIDGEGSIVLHRSGKWRCPGLSVTSTSVELLEWLKSEFGGGISSKNETRPKHSPSWQWRLSAPATMVLLPQILPYLREKKKLLRARFIIKGFALAKAEGTREAFEREFYALGVSELVVLDSHTLGACQLCE